MGAWTYYLCYSIGTVKTVEAKLNVKGIREIEKLLRVTAQTHLERSCVFAAEDHQVVVILDRRDVRDADSYVLPEDPEEPINIDSYDLEGVNLFDMRSRAEPRLRKVLDLLGVEKAEEQNFWMTARHETRVG